MTETVAVPPPSKGDSAQGFLFAFSAYFLWGLLPIFLKMVAHIPPMEVVAHRVVWSVPIAAVVLLLLGRTADVRKALRSPRTLLLAALTASLITANWGLYVWAIATDRALDTALGYYINPLVSIAMAAVFLGEKFTRLQLAAVALATAAVAVLTIESGGLPWLSLMIAMTFAVYGFLRKTLPIGPSQGFFLEVLILSVPALAYIAWLQWTGQGHFGLGQPENMVLLLACGPVTACPFLLYAFGAKALRYATIGIMQYIAPSMVFITAVFIFKEPFSRVQAFTFALIWIALALYTWPMLRGAKVKAVQ
ncbi:MULTISPECIES: EamA family transporter RarD [Chelativorans]|jgi:chloramphenicol-sensitive protein RarD|uniref:RarD protein, DMT superfamily transporter n=1 Tax=Chelativorans sp. (strain BNC1) TaxID=266779 RepID=Q11JQ8_CHESB|nr:MULTISPECIES: EamA family transporter RarD [Chelativorans]